MGNEPEREQAGLIDDVAADVVDGQQGVDPTLQSNADDLGSTDLKVKRRGSGSDWSFGTGLMTSVVRWGTALVLLIAPIAAVASWLAPQEVTGASRSEAVMSAREAAQNSLAASGAATSLVWAWWSATSETGAAVLAPLVAGGVDDDIVTRLPNEAPLPPRVVVVRGTTQVSQFVWQVSITVVDAVGESCDYFVPVAVANGGGTALTLPAQIPNSQRAGESPIDQRDAELDGPLADAVTGFATALLTGGTVTDISRWTSPGTSVEPITGRNYNVIELDALALLNSTGTAEPIDGATADVLATFAVGQEGRTPAESDDQDQQAQDQHRRAVAESVSLQYTLRLAARDGRWEVQAITTPGVR